MKVTIVIAVMAGLALASSPGPEADRDAIEATALDYIEGWYEADGSRMASALHPELAKRMVYEQAGSSMLNDQTKEILVERTSRGGGSSTPPDQRKADVRILDVFGNAAVVRVEATDWVDYLQIAKWDDRWLIVNVLWELTPEAKARRGA